LYRKSHESGLWITEPRLALGPWWTRDHRAARPLQGSRGRRDSSERERRSSGFSSMAPLGGGAAEMTTRRCSTESTGDALMGRWFRARGGDWSRGGCGGYGGALIAPFIGP
jgi:hypothetical protein